MSLRYRIDKNYVLNAWITAFWMALPKDSVTPMDKLNCGVQATLRTNIVRMAAKSGAWASLGLPLVLKQPNGHLIKAFLSTMAKIQRLALYTVASA